MLVCRKRLYLIFLLFMLKIDGCEVYEPEALNLTCFCLLGDSFDVPHESFQASNKEKFIHFSRSIAPHGVLYNHRPIPVIILRYMNKYEDDCALIPYPKLSPTSYIPNQELPEAKSELQGETVGVCSSYKRGGQPPYNSALRSLQMCLHV